MLLTELRIGNIVGRQYVNPNPGGTTLEIEPCFVNEICKSAVNITVSLKNNYRVKVPCNLLHPIPITQWWLEKFGFNHIEINGFGGWFRKNIIFVIIEKEIPCVELHLGEERIPIEIEYVHQLQNLYYAITGKELYERNT